MPSSSPIRCAGLGLLLAGAGCSILTDTSGFTAPIPLGTTTIVDGDPDGSSIDGSVSQNDGAPTNLDASATSDAPPADGVAGDAPTDGPLFDVNRPDTTAPDGGWMCPVGAVLCSDFSGTPPWAGECNPAAIIGSGRLSSSPANAYQGGCFHDVSPPVSATSAHFESSVTISVTGQQNAELGQIVLKSGNATAYAGFAIENGHLRFMIGNLDLGFVPNGTMQLDFDIDFISRGIVGHVNGTQFVSQLSAGNWEIHELDVALSYVGGSGWVVHFDNVLVTYQ